MEGRELGGGARVIRAVFGLSPVDCCSCLPIIRVAGLHHESYLDMMWLLMQSIIPPSALRQILKDTYNSMGNQFEYLHVGNMSGIFLSGNFAIWGCMADIITPTTQINR